MTKLKKATEFLPRGGAAGYQVSNPSALDLSAVVASLEIFGQVTMADLRHKSLQITFFLERLLSEPHPDKDDARKLFTIMTPRDPNQRGAQLSLQLKSGLLTHVLHELEEHGVVVDERKPDVIRVAPAPLYNTYADVWDFVEIFFEACRNAAR